jgi:hypothetical protein
VFVQEDYFRREPAECTSVPAGENSLASITCRGATDRELGFAGDQIDALSGTFFVPSTLQSDNGSGPKQRERTAALGTRRAIRSDGAAVDACDRQLAHHWEASVPARGVLGLPTDDAARLSYLDSGGAHGFIGGCLAPTGAEFPAALPTIAYRPVRPELPAFSAVERRARERELVGTWLQKHSYFTDEWSFTAAEQIDRYGHHAYRFARPHELVIGPDYPPHASRIVRDTADRMFIEDSGIDCPPDLTHAEIALGMDLLVIRGDACSVITRTDRLATTSCTHAGRKLALRYVDDDAHDLQLGFEQVDGCYVQNTVAPFVRRVQ